MYLHWGCIGCQSPDGLMATHAKINNCIISYLLNDYNHYSSMFSPYTLNVGEKTV